MIDCVAALLKYDDSHRAYLIKDMPVQPALRDERSAANVGLVGIREA